MKPKDWENIFNNIDNGVYKVIRLVNVDGGKQTIVVPFNPLDKDKKNLRERFAYIKSKVNHGLSPGKYQIHCRINPSNHLVQDVYELEIKDATKIYSLSNTIEDKTHEQTTDMNIDPDKYIEMVRENERLKSLNALLEIERNMYKEQLATYKNNPGLSDGATVAGAKSGIEVLGDVMKEVSPSLVNLTDRFFNILEKRADNEKLKIENGVVKKIGGKKTMVTNKNNEQEEEDMTFEQEVQEEADYFEQLQKQDPEAFEKELDELEKEDEELYNAVCEELGLFDEEEDGDGKEQEK